jgi:GNAT superfamily N-acetyltransferase
MPLEYISADITRIELIRPLWDQLNRHHLANARTFKDHYERWTFDDRKAYFAKVAKTGLLRVDLAMDKGSGRYVGYCISSLAEDGDGEIESVYVEEAFRTQGIGSALVTRALAWLTENRSARIRVSVADGNEDVFPFYQEFGFHPRLTVLERKTD